MKKVFVKLEIPFEVEWGQARLLSIFSRRKRKVGIILWEIKEDLTASSNYAQKEESFWVLLTLSKLLSYVFYFLTFSPILLHFLLSSYVFVLRNLFQYGGMNVFDIHSNIFEFLEHTFKCQRMNYETRLTNMTITQMKGFCDFLLRIYMNVGNASYSLTYSHSLKITQNVSFEYWHFQHFLSY